MVILKIKGGLGNQMFQYSRVVSLADCFDIKLDISYYDYFPNRNSYLLEEIFNISNQVASENEISSLTHYGDATLTRLIRKITPKKTLFLERTYEKSNNINFIKQYSIFGNLYLDGYWEDFRYLDGYEDAIKSIFKFPPISESKNSILLSKINNTKSVSIHLRRGDKLNSDIHHVPTLDYYLSAINKIKKLINDDNLSFFVFSDDIEWAKNGFLGLEDKFEYVDWNIGDKSFRDMQLMSQCDHNIISSSTFSWWAAYLNDNMQKVVISPTNMFKASFKHLENIHFFPHSWIQI